MEVAHLALRMKNASMMTSLQSNIEVDGSNRTVTQFHNHSIKSRALNRLNNFPLSLRESSVGLN